MLVGVESQLAVTAIKKTRAQRAHRMASVLQEQKKQARERIHDPSRLGFVSLGTALKVCGEASILYWWEVTFVVIVR